MIKAGIFVLAASLMVAVSLPAAAAPPENLARKGDKLSYVVVMEQAPLTTYDGRIPGYAPTKPGKGAKINPNSAHVKKYGQFLKDAHSKALQSVGAAAQSKINEYTFALNGFSALMTPDQAEKMKRQPGVSQVLVDERRYPQTNSSPAYLGLTASDGAWLAGYTGEGVIVGVIDTGIWPEHPSFADDGTYTHLPGFAAVPCEFGNTTHNTNDATFACNNKLLGARQLLATYRAELGKAGDEFDSARDDEGHGTHTASTAAGNRGVTSSIQGVSHGAVSGIAPRARIIAYKGLGKFGGFSSDLAAAIDQAVADGVDVINYSVGSGNFNISADDIAFLFAADAGVFVAAANGNAGPLPATIGSPASVPWVTSVGASTQQRFFQGSASSSAGWQYLGASITAGTAQLPLVDGANAGDEYCRPGSLRPADVEGKIVLCQTQNSVRLVKSQAVLEAGGAGMILYNYTNDEDLAFDSHYLPAVHINRASGLAIKSYIGTAGTSAVAMINAGQVNVPAPWMADFSSRGPNRLSADIVKPDITAPGVQILAGVSPLTYSFSDPRQLFGVANGTSMASPHIAGVFALIKQAHPDWSAAIAKSAIMTTAFQNVKKENGVAPADPFDMGAGHVKPGNPAAKGSVFQPGLAYDAGLQEYQAFTCGASLYIVSDQACADLNSIGVPMDTRNLNLPSIGLAQVVGKVRVSRTVTSVAKEGGWRDYQVSVEAPPGFSVSVSPTKLRLKRGDSATYEVTVTNAAAPGGEWRHGALTWTDKTGNYKVRSPISVRAQ